MGEVFLGMPGPWAEDSHEASDHFTSKIGGLPDWPFPEASMGPDLSQCTSCGSSLCLVAQVYAPISGLNSKIEERVIYVFGCTNFQCGRWRAIRVQKSDNYEESKTAEPEVAPAALSSDSKWLDDLYSFGSDGEELGDNEDIDIGELSRAFSEAASLGSGSKRLNVKKLPDSNEKRATSDPKTREYKGIPVLPCFYIYGQEERSSKGVASLYSSFSSLLLKESQEEEEERWEGEVYEYDRSLNADRTYLKFKKRMDANPEQCFRYSCGGKPLLAVGELGDPGTCGLCGGSRRYEMQLMPPLLYYLQEAASSEQEIIMENWNWMTLIVYTCSKSCSYDGDILANRQGWMVAEEAVIAQFDRPLNQSVLPSYFS